MPAGRRAPTSGGRLASLTRSEGKARPNTERGAFVRLRTGARSYEGADRENAARVVGAICSLSGLLTLIFLPLDPPTEAVGGAGWALAGALGVLSLLAGRELRRGSPPTFAVLLVISYLGLAQVAFLTWLGGGLDTAYQALTLPWIGSAMGVHPLPRALAFLGASALVTGAPLAYEGWDETSAAGTAADFALWTVLGLVLLGLMSYVRSQRVSLREQEQEAQQLARADALTGLANRRAFDEALNAELARSRRASSTTSVVLIDVDRLKEINDRFGHLSGDRCLRDVAASIARALRAGDRAFRWGGDEFALLLPDTDLTGADEAAARIAAQVLITCSDDSGKPLSISWGAAEDEPDMSTDQLLGQADLALMTVKREKAAR